MYEFPVPKNEAERLKSLESCDIMDSLPEQAYDDIARLAANICGVERAMVAFIDGERKWHKARFNVGPTEVPRGFAICSHTIMSSNPLVVDDARSHDEISQLGIVTNPPYVRFYAGVPLVDDNGCALGTICAIDTEPHSLTDQQVESLQALARQVMQLISLRRHIIALEQQEQQLRQYQQELDRANLELQQQSITDPLTGLNNRRALQITLADEIACSEKTGQPLSLLVMDIDHFKRVNDQLGHSTGDQVLIRVARQLRDQLRSNDFISRYGGEEFVVLLPNTPLHEACHLAEGYRQVIACDLGEPPLTISIGVAEYDHQTCTRTLFSQADEALFNAKRTGRDKVCHAPAPLNPHSPACS